MNEFDKKYKLKILHLIPNLGTGGAQRVFVQLSEFLTSKFYVDLYAFDLKAKDVYGKQIKVNSLDVHASKHFYQKLFNLFWRIRKLSKVKKKNKYAVSISHLEGADLINVLTGKYDKKIVVIHGAKTSDVKYKGIYSFFRHKILIPLVLKRSDKVVCVSEGIKQELIEVFHAQPKKLEVIFNYFEHERIVSLSKEPINNVVIDSIFSNYRVIINCARLDIQKNQMSLIDVFHRCELVKNNLKLFILGEGNLLGPLVNYANELGLKVFSFSGQQELTTGYDVYFLGNQSNPFKFIHKAKFSILTSGWEGFPLTIGESMICGTPVVSTDCPTGPREILAPGTPLNYYLKNAEYSEYGILMPLLEKKKKNYDEVLSLWATTINYAINNPEVLNQYSVKSIERSKDFSKEVITAKWLNLINNIHKTS